MRWRARGTEVDCSVCCGQSAKSLIAATCKDSVAIHRSPAPPLRRRSGIEPHDQAPGNFRCTDHRLITEAVLVDSFQFLFPLARRRRHHLHHRQRHLRPHLHPQSLARTSHTSAAVPATRYLLWSKVGLAFLSPKRQSDDLRLSGRSALRFHAIFH